MSGRFTQVLLYYMYKSALYPQYLMQYSLTLGLLICIYEYILKWKFSDSGAYYFYYNEEKEDANMRGSVGIQGVQFSLSKLVFSFGIYLIYRHT